MASEHFEAFVAGVNAPIRSKDDVDQFPNLDAVLLLDDEERTAVEDILMAKLAEDDGRAASALAEIRCTRAIPALEQRLAVTSFPMVRESITAALRELRTERDSLHGGAVRARLERVWNLAGDARPSAQAALETAAFTELSGIVQSAALDALLARRELILYDVPYRSVLRYVTSRACSSLPSVRTEALGELRQLFDRLAAGETPEQLGLTWSADRGSPPLRDFVSYLDGSHPRVRYPYEELAGLAGQERRWVEDVLLSQLPSSIEDVRAVALLGIRRAVEPLRELIPIAEYLPVGEIEAALDQLTGTHT